MKSYFKIAKGFVYLIAELVWFLVVSIPLAFTLLLFVELVSIIKSIYNQIKSVCQRITTR